MPLPRKFPARSLPRRRLFLESLENRLAAGTLVGMPFGLALGLGGDLPEREPGPSRATALARAEAAPVATAEAIVAPAAPEALADILVARVSPDDTPLPVRTFLPLTDVRTDSSLDWLTTQAASLVHATTTLASAGARTGAPSGAGSSGPLGAGAQGPRAINAPTQIATNGLEQRDDYAWVGGATVAGWPGVTLDLTVAGYEITQSIQRLDNSVGLVGDKATMVRVTVGVTGSDSPVEGVDGWLYVYQGDEFVTVLPSINGPITAQLAPSRDEENDTLNFLLPPLTGWYVLYPYVNPTSEIPEVDYDNNWDSTDWRNFDCRRTPNIMYVPTDYRPTATGPDPNVPPADWIAPGAGDAFVRAAYPIGDLNYYIQEAPPLLWTLNINSSSGAFQNTLGNIRRMSVPVPDMIYGWLPGNPFSGNGQASTPNMSAFGNTDAARYLRTFAHELGHLFGMSHNSRRINEVGIDVEDRVGLGRIKPATFYDIMVAGRLTNEAWIDVTSYNYVRSRPILGCGAAPAGVPSAADGQLLISGLVDNKGRALLNPVYHLAGAAGDSDGVLSPGEERPKFVYTVRVEDRFGNVQSREVGAEFDTDSDDEAESGGFSLALPAPSSVARVQLLHEGKVLDEMVRSPNAPRAKFQLEQTTLAGVTTLRWGAFDADGDRLTYALRYSPDGGQTFTVLAVDQTASEWKLDVGFLRPSTHGLLQLIVTDGLNTTTVNQPVQVLPGRPS